MIKCQNKSLYHIVFWLILAVAGAVRLVALGDIPADIHQDEAMTGYEAFSLLMTGADSRGIPFPVYLTAWGSGTSVLYGWLIELCFSLFGVSIWALRLPQAIIGIFGCYVFYRLLRIFGSRAAALTGFFLISIMPWTVMNARWGLDANLAPILALMGFYFYCRSVKQTRYLYLSVIFYVLTMYAYAVYWVFLVPVLMLQWIYWWWYQGIKQTQIVFWSAVLGGVLTLPLILLVLVNNGLIDEIRTTAFSIPKLLSWRGGEIGFHDFEIKFQMLFNILVKQNDGWISSVIPAYGLFYSFTPLFMLLGFGVMIWQVRRDISARRFSFALCVLWQIVIGMIYAVSIYSFSNRVNFLFMPLTLAATLGVVVLLSRQWLFCLVIGGYLAAFGAFVHTYFTRYNQMVAVNYAYSFSSGITKALAKAEELYWQSGAEIYFLEEPYLYAKILLLGQVSPELYRQTVEWYNYPDGFLQARRFLYYHFEGAVDFAHLPAGRIYVAHRYREPYFAGVPYTVHGNYIVALKR